MHRLFLFCSVAVGKKKPTKKTKSRTSELHLTLTLCNQVRVKKSWFLTYLSFVFHQPIPCNVLSVYRNSREPAQAQWKNALHRISSAVHWTSFHMQVWNFVVHFFFHCETVLHWPSFQRFLFCCRWFKNCWSRHEILSFAWRVFWGLSQLWNLQDRNRQQVLHLQSLQLPTCHW